MHAEGGSEWIGSCLIWYYSAVLSSLTGDVEISQTMDNLK